MIELSSAGLNHPQTGQPMLVGASLAVAPGQLAVIHGGDAVRTASLTAAMVGEAAVAAGAISLFGNVVHRLRRASLRVLRRHVGIVPHNLALLPDRSALHNVSLPLEMDGISRRVACMRAAELLDQLELAAEQDAPLEQLSWAGRQRVAVARAMVRLPHAVIADQPTSLQDEHGTSLIARMLERAAERGAAVLVLSRDALLRQCADVRGWAQWAWHDSVLVADGHAVAADAIFVDDIGVAGKLTGGVVGQYADDGSIDVQFDSAPVAAPVVSAVTAMTPSAQVRAAARGYAVDATDAVPHRVGFPLTARTVGAP